MHSGWMRVFVLVAVAAVLANAHCYGTCGNTDCGSAPTPSNNCHHQKSSHENHAPCPHQHSDFAGPEAAIAKAGIATAILVLPALTADSTAIVTQPEFLSGFDTGSPPGVRGCSFAVSVLRI